MQLHTLLGNDVYKTYRAEAAARHKEAAAKHQQQQGTATPSAPQASAPSHSLYIVLQLPSPRESPVGLFESECSLV